MKKYLFILLCLFALCFAPMQAWSSVTPDQDARGKGTPDDNTGNADSSSVDVNGVVKDAATGSVAGVAAGKDANGNVLTYINEANNKTVNTYDSEDRLVKTVTYETPDSTSNGLTIRYIYDADGNLIQTIYPNQYNSENDNLDVANGVN